MEDARTAIKFGIENGSLENPELMNEILEKLKGKPEQAAGEVLLTVALLLDPLYLMSILEHLRGLSAAKALHMIVKGAEKKSNPNNTNE